ncbi:MAG: serine/threonine protein kinase/tetratricopeptide (TPR) repeat protein [Planctomycetota bacterium]|jgi:serine/threonine protein kinase/tetratricopeptide (TPR) repeat protein
MTYSRSEEHDSGSAAGDDVEQAGANLGDSSTPGEGLGDLIDRYKLIEEIGEGGMGTVWMAQQSEPVKRQVALKIIKLGMDTREVVVRFEAERQALAMMDHPHIAKVLDGGATVSGRPFFVMELVKGTPITEYCDEVKLDLHGRLELFAKVCEGIQHAHQKGLIHRDIKPGNVLVTLQDGEPVPKVIDFGIAKATSTELTEATMLTEHGQMLGTPEYMAPEQLGMSGRDIDTRADVYSLGVLLYELLTGTKPFDIRTVIETGYDELLRTIREVDPDKPSTRITKVGESASSIATNRRVDQKALGKGLGGDLDWIVMMALEKDRTRRYETANGLAADVRRFLSQEPVVAAPPSATYRVRKFVRRRKKTVVAIATIAILLIVGSIGTGIGWLNTKRANQKLGLALTEKNDALAEEARQRELAQENETRARKAEADALVEAERAKLAEAETAMRAAELLQVADFQAAQLSEIDPELMGVRLRRALIDAAPPERRETLTANLPGINFTSLALGTLEANLFERTLEAIDAQFENQPTVQAQLLQTMAETLDNLGLFDAAGAPQERALSIRRSLLGDDHPDTLHSLNYMGTLLRSRGELIDAVPFYREALEGRRRVLGDDHPSTLESIHCMGLVLRNQGKLSDAEPFFLEALEGYRRVQGDDHPSTLLAITGVGSLLNDQGKLLAAEPFYRESLGGHRRVLGDDHPNTLSTINSLGLLLKSLGNLAEAEPLLREGLEGYRRVRGDDHPSTLSSLNSLGLLFLDKGRLTDAEPLLREALEGYRRVLGDDHPSTLVSMLNMGSLLQAQGKLSDAEAILRKALEGNRRTLGDDHPSTLISINKVGALLWDQGKLAEAEPLFRETLEGHRRLFGDDHPATLNSLNSMGALLQVQGNLSDAEPFLRKTLEGNRRLFGDDHPATLNSLNNMGTLLLAQGKLSGAESFLREALEGRRRVFGDNHSSTLNSIHNLKDGLQERVTVARATGGKDALAEAQARLGAFRLALDDHVSAEQLLAEALDQFFRVLPESDPRPRQVLSDLGASIAGQGRNAEAEYLLRESAEWMLANSPASSALADERYAEAGIVTPAIVVQRVVEFYEAWHTIEPAGGYQASALEWRERKRDWEQATDE